MLLYYILIVRYLYIYNVLTYVLYFSVMSDYYKDYVYAWTVPVLLPLAQISLTASVYTTVVICFVRYNAICRPTHLGNGNAFTNHFLTSST